MRSLKDRQACLFSSVKYAKFVNSPLCHLREYKTKHLEEIVTQDTMRLKGTEWD